jgi:hypothetical protein
MSKNRRYPKSVAWSVDQDYWHNLSKDERAWLHKFNLRYYNADFSSSKADSSADWSREEKRASYNRKNTANRDVFTNPTQLAKLKPDK